MGKLAPEGCFYTWAIGEHESHTCLEDEMHTGNHACTCGAETRGTSRYTIRHRPNLFSRTRNQSNYKRDLEFAAIIGLAGFALGLATYHLLRIVGIF